jgi:hypothetical protein
MLTDIVRYMVCRKELFTYIHYAYGFDSLPESRRAATHDLALADQFSVELGSVKREVDVEVNAVEGSLGSVHALKVFLEILP